MVHLDARIQQLDMINLQSFEAIFSITFIWQLDDKCDWKMFRTIDAFITSLPYFWNHFLHICITLKAFSHL